MDKEQKCCKSNSKNIIIVVIAIATALICIALTFWGNWKNNGVLTTDAFVAIMATFIGVCATIIVGVQIVNHLELRQMHDAIKAIEEERKELEKQREKLSVIIYNTRLCLGNALTLIANTAQKNGDIVTEFNAWVQSIISDDWNSMSGDALLNRYKQLAKISANVMLHDNIEFFIRTYNTLSILVVPQNIEHYDEIMVLHHKLLADLKDNISKKSKEPHLDTK